MKCDYCGFSAFGKHKCLSCGAPAAARSDYIPPEIQMQQAKLACEQQMLIAQMMASPIRLVSTNPMMAARIFQ